MYNRRQFIRTAGAATLTIGPLSSAVAAAEAGRRANPLFRGMALSEVPDQDKWAAVQQEFAVDRSLIHLNNGGVCPAPESVQRALHAHQAASNRRPFYAHQGEIAAQRESVRSGLSAMLGVDSEEVALTRNASEGMEICLLGHPMEAGDEVVTTDHDYPRMLQTLAQRSQRDGIVVKSVPVAVPLTEPDQLVRAIARAITPRTRLVMCCHMVDLTGQILPVARIVEEAHRRGVPVLVDGAQTFGQVPFTIPDLGCDFYATSLHKWLMAPEGTGLLYVRRDRIAPTWPLMPANPDRIADVRKFEDVGTQCAAPTLATAEALRFHESIGGQDKFDRLCYLRDYWLESLLPHERVTLLTERSAAGSLCTIAVEDMDPVSLRNHLWERYRIRVRPIRQVNVTGIRVSPGIYTTLPELDRFVAVMKQILTEGLPTT